MTTQIAYSNEFLKHNNTTHPENAERLIVMINEIKKASFYNELDFIKPSLLKEDILFDVHSREMIQRVKDYSLDGNSWLDPDTYVCKSDYEIARLAAGSLLKLSKNVIDKKADNAFAIIRPPGHHATKNRSMGFCLFNNIAIAASEISKLGKRILIFDLDVHHGNGTQDIFYDRKDIMYQSFHLHPHFPGTGYINEIGEGEGKGSTINAPLRYSNGNTAVSDLLDKIFLPIAKQFKPDIILVSSGFDSHHTDLYGGLRLTANFFGEIIARLQSIQPAIVCTLEGGYNLDWIGKCLLSQISQLINNPIHIEDNTKENNTASKVIEKIKNEIQSYWDL
jgi:acetoin utilization deacetylase AcuC-like enzyme